MRDTDAMPGDLCIINSWGVVTRGNKEHLVLIDYGINYETYWIMGLENIFFSPANYRRQLKQVPEKDHLYPAKRPVIIRPIKT